MYKHLFPQVLLSKVILSGKRSPCSSSTFESSPSLHFLLDVREITSTFSVTYGSNSFFIDSLRRASKTKLSNSAIIARAIKFSVQLIGSVAVRMRATFATSVITVVKNYKNALLKAIV